MTDSIWKTLSAIDCSEHVEKKGQFSYLSWTWAWAMVKEKYPMSSYQLLDDTIYTDGTMEVRVQVTVMAVEGANSVGLSHTMWLPVLDFKNKAIPNPNAFDINSARMRCLVKCLAMFGLGHYIYAGDSLPQPAGLSDDEYDVFLSRVADKDGFGLAEYMAQLGEDKCNEAYNRAPQGKKVQFKKDVQAVLKQAHALYDNYAHELITKAELEDHSGVMELVEELEDPFTKKNVWGRLSEVQKHQITEIIKGAQ